MRNSDAQAQIIGQPLQFRLPRAEETAIAAAGIGRDEERLGVREACCLIIVHH